MESFIEKKDSLFIIQHKKFCDNIGDVKVLLEIIQTRLDKVLADQVNLKYVLDGMGTYATYEKSVTAKKNGLRFGKDETVLISLVQPIIWTLPLKVNMNAGVQKRFEAIIQDCMNSPKMTYEIGVTLGFIKAIVPFVPGNGTPDLGGQVSAGGHPHLECTIGNYSGYAIYKDSGTGYGAAKFDQSEYHDWLDQRTPLPAKDVSQVVKYKTKYIYQGEEVGHFSAELTLVLLGVV